MGRGARAIYLLGKSSANFGVFVFFDFFFFKSLEPIVHSFIGVVKSRLVMGKSYELERCCTRYFQSNYNTK